MGSAGLQYSQTMFENETAGIFKWMKFRNECWQECIVGGNQYFAWEWGSFYGA